MLAGTAQAPLQHMRILVVENEFLIAASLEGTLLRAGAKEVEIASTLQEARETLKLRAFDGVILDIRLPDGESFTLGSELLSNRTPVVIHSGHAERHHSTKLPLAVLCAKPSTEAEVVSAMLEAQASQHVANGPSEAA